MAVTHKALLLLLLLPFTFTLCDQEDSPRPKRKDFHHKESKRKSRKEKERDNDCREEDDQEERHDTECRNKECRKPEELSRAFDAQLSFDQELVLVRNTLVARVATLAEEENAPRVSGRIELCFSRDLSSVRYKLFVFDAQGRDNPNERITQATLNAGRAYQNGPAIVTLFEHADTKESGKEVDGLLAKGVLTADDLNGIDTASPVVSQDGQVFNSIAALFDGCRRCEVYAQVSGGRYDEQKPCYEDGIIRGEVFSAEMTN